MDEFALIHRYFSALTSDGHGVALGIGDDAALLRPTPGHELAVTTDTLIAGRHFPQDTDAFDIGWKSLAVNLSDLAAMAATPRWFTLALTLPQPDATWLAAFADGLKALADRHEVALVGGDTTRGALSITITAIGEVPAAGALRRDRARAGDAIAVTGSLGDAALALRSLQSAHPQLLERLNRPQPRIAAGLALRNLAHAAVDLSDGLHGDLGHILAASAVGARLDVDALPMSTAFAAAGVEESLRRILQLAGGDDYELCVCLPAECIELAEARDGIGLTVIGHITAEPGLRLVDRNGATIDLDLKPYRHFP